MPGDRPQGAAHKPSFKDKQRAAEQEEPSAAPALGPFVNHANPGAEMVWRRVCQGVGCHPQHCV